MKNFALTGVAGYIAQRHLQAIKDTGNVLVAAVDPHDSVGIMDKYFPNAGFFTEFERFDRYLEMLRRGPKESNIDYLTVCSPNHLHDAHIRLALRIGADAICEKPLVLNTWNLDALQELEQEYDHKIYNILQLRVHPSIIELKEQISKQKNKRFDVELNYITSRGTWYDYSWKGDPNKSGGVVTNIGIHFFDMLIWIFGGVNRMEVLKSELHKISGTLELKNADVKWNLSIDYGDLPEQIKHAGKTTFRSIKVDNVEVHFSDGFTDLHTKVYQAILSGNGFGIDDARPSIEAVYNIREIINKF